MDVSGCVFPMSKIFLYKTYGIFRHSHSRSSRLLVVGGRVGVVIEEKKKQFWRLFGRERGIFGGRSVEIFLSV